MARGTTLADLLDQYRSACRLSNNNAHNNQHRDTQIRSLREKQEWFWGDYAWPHLRVDRNIDVEAGARTYSMPDDLDIDRITKVAVRYGSQWVPVKWGIDDGHYAAHDSDLDQRAWPPQRCRMVEDEQLEIWPIPDQNFDEDTLEGRVRLTGIRTLSPLIEEADTADLDDQLIVKSAAADYLAATGAKDAQLKLDEANRLYTKIRGRLMPRRKFRLFGSTEPARRPMISHYTPPES